MESNSPLPKFDNPPVIETVLSVEFERLRNWGIPHFGLFWSKVRSAFPNWEVKPPIGSTIEDFEKPIRSVQPTFELLNELEARCWFKDAEDKTLIQVQNNRLIYNWRKGQDKGEKYPSYNSSVRPSLESVWKEFQDFVIGEDLGDLKVVQCEVTYINHIEIGEGWESIDDLDEVYCLIKKTSEGKFLPAPEGLNFNLAYRMPDKRGRLRVTSQHAIRNQDGKEIIRLDISAKVRPNNEDLISALECLDYGREWVVRGFADLTTEKMHKLWKRRA